MSIINEALRKAGQEKLPENIVNRSVSPPVLTPAGALAGKKILPELPKKKQKVNWGPLFVVLVLLLITGPLIAPIFSSPYRNTVTTYPVPSYQETLKASEAPKVPAASNLKAQFAIEELPVAPIARPVPFRPDFAINGIVYSSPNSYCIINGRVVQVGEKIDGAKLISVTPEKATLEYQGDKMDLWVNH